MKLYIAVLDEFPDYMTPTLVAHSMLSAHLLFNENELYNKWLIESFRKCVVRVNRKEFEKIKLLPLVHLGHENHTLNGEKACAVVCPYLPEDVPKVLRFAKLWKPDQSTEDRINANRYIKLRRWMSSNVPEGWQEVERMGAVASWQSLDDMDQYLDTLPECTVGLWSPRAE